MRQRGVALIIPLIIIAIVAVTGFIVYKQIKPSQRSPNVTVITNTATPSGTPKITTPVPTPVKTIKPTQIPTATPVKTVAPVKTAAPVSNSTCGITAFADSQNQLGVKLTYSSSSSNGSYVTGAQWDFDGNGSWDTDMSINNSNVNHTYSGNGTYTVKLQLKMSDGTTTGVCSKNVSVPSGFTVSLTGQVYEDANCNGLQEPDEKGISGVTVNIINVPAWSMNTTLTSDNNGYYNFTKILSPGESLTIQPGAVAADGYKIHADNHTVTLDGSQSSININLPLVPDANISQCH